MLGSKNNFFVDRRVYPFKGKWKDPKQDLEKNIYYFVNSHTLVESYENGRGQMKDQITITIYGEHPICANDKFYLDNGDDYKAALEAGKEVPVLVVTFVGGKATSATYSDGKTE